MKAQKLPNLFGHAHIQYFDTNSACKITYTYVATHYTLLFTAAYSHYASLNHVIHVST